MSEAAGEPALSRGLPVSTRLQILDGGTVSCDLSWLLLKPGRTLRARSDRDRPPEWYRCASYAVLIETPRGRLLWDTGAPPDWATRWQPAGVADFFEYEPSEPPNLVDRLAALGVSAADLDYVVLSHLHFAHAGNLRALAEAGAQTLICDDKEREFAFGFDEPLVGHHLRADYDGLDLQTVSGDNELLPGVTLIEAPGHTPGQLCLRVDLPDTGVMILASDAVPLVDAYGPPAVCGALVHDLAQYYASVEKIRAIAARDDATVIFGHDIDQIRSLRQAPEAYG